MTQQSIFLDLEAGIDTAQDIKSSSENKGSFIDNGEEYSDDTADLGTANLSPVLLTQGQDHIWNSLLERAKAHGNVRESMLVGEGSYDFCLLDDAPELWILSCILSWEDIIVFHIGQSVPSELGIQAAFIMPHLDKQVWLEADMSSALKMWLVDIPGMAWRNQQVQLHAIDEPRLPWQRQHPKLGESLGN
ncbi:hypothetical protein ARMGADRAFT_1078979 [Armillaria gallica]|uniref:Uncharacterized protein n=1 Tax=Armillaria gallica TaxID=47427 RepID=A0A2H3DKA0_ARMGA|nr:hypothetical protein ARMGADRAFT_1078979 [Armillaria gallica]